MDAEKHTIKIKNLNEIIEQIKEEGFATDGCACGDWGYSISDDLHLYSHRSCRKSGNTPSDKWWHVGEIELYKKISKGYREYNDKVYVSFVEVDEEDEILDFELCKEQKEILMNIMRDISFEIYGVEYKADK